MSDPPVDVVSGSGGREHAVTPLELFFDLALVFAVTQVSSLLVNDPDWGGVLRGMLVLAALWWAWSGYAWLTSTVDVDEGGVRLAVLAAMTAMLIAALAVPDVFGDDGLLFGVAYLIVRVLHLVLYATVGRADPDLRRRSCASRPASSPPACSSSSPVSWTGTPASPCGWSPSRSTTSARS